MSKGTDLADSLLAIFSDNSGYGENGPTLVQAVGRLEHLSATKTELWEAIAVLALQANNYRRMSNLDAELAVRNIEHIVKEYRARRQGESL